jgi:hypothetical protein
MCKANDGRESFGKKKIKSGIKGTEEKIGGKTQQPSTKYKKLFNMKEIGFNILSEAQKNQVAFLFFSSAMSRGNCVRKRGVLGDLNFTR